MSTRPLRAILRDRRGVALPMALLSLVLLTTLIIAFSLLASTEPSIATNASQPARVRSSGPPSPCQTPEPWSISEPNSVIVSAQLAWSRTSGRTSAVMGPLHQVRGMRHQPIETPGLSLLG